MAGNKFIFKDAEKARNAISAKQKKEIQKLYSKWADEIAEKAKKYANKDTSSSALKARQMRELEKMLRNSSKEVSSSIKSVIKDNMTKVSDMVVQSNKDWLVGLGFNGIDMAFNHVSKDVVESIITGQVYESGWSLSKRIWSDNEQTLKDIHTIVAKGVAQNVPIEQIAKELETYVNPSKRMAWNYIAPDGARIYKHKVDYNAQRLARTLVQHSYQQSFVAVTKNNPLITDYIWNANGSRVCPLCMDRDQQHFKKWDLPLDHPNGMCTIIPNVDDNIEDTLANWINGEENIELDNYAKSLGYTLGG